MGGVTGVARVWHPDLFGLAVRVSDIGTAVFAAFAFVVVLRIMHSVGVVRSNEFSWTAASIAACIVAVPVGIAVLHEPAPAPQNASVYGCYVSDMAPAVFLDEEGMHILQPGFPTIPFHLERHTRGIALTADEPIQARAADDRYIYSFYQPGIGTFLSFFREDNGQRHGVYDISQMSGFIMVARSAVPGNSGNIQYTKVSDENCA